MTYRHRRRFGATSAVRRFAIASGAALFCLALVTAAPIASAAPATLVGTFQLTPGSCAGGAASGTYLRMILPSGGPSGPFMSNSDSTCSDQSFTLLAPGSDGGLVAGSYQPQPTPPFDASGNARASNLTAPARFYGTSFATSTNSVDPQTKQSVPPPQVIVTGGTLSADLRSFAVTWNSQYFNQGSPKPDGSYPGNTRPVTGTFDTSTNRSRSPGPARSRVGRSTSSPGSGT